MSNLKKQNANGKTKMKNSPKEDETADTCRLVRLRQAQSGSKLGFSLRGGKEQATGFSVGVFVSHVQTNGQAHKNGLRVGDQLIQVNGLQVSQATYDEVIELIRRAKGADILLLVKFVGRIPYQEKFGEPISWLSVAANESAAAAAAEEEATRKQLSVYRDGDSAAASSRSLSFASCSSASSSPSSSSSSSVASSGADDDEEECGPAATHSKGRRLERACKASSSSTSGCSMSTASGTLAEHGLGCQPIGPDQLSGSFSSLALSVADDPDGFGGALPSEEEDDDDDDDDGDLLDRDKSAPLVEIVVPGGRRTSEPFGCGVVKGPDEWPGIFVQNVRPASLAERVGLQPGDQLVSADELELSQRQFDEAIGLIKRLQQQQDELRLGVRKGAALRHLANCKSKRLASTPPLICIAPQSAKGAATAVADGGSARATKSTSGQDSERRGIAAAAEEEEKEEDKSATGSLEVSREAALGANVRRSNKPPPPAPLLPMGCPATCEQPVARRRQRTAQAAVTTHAIGASAVAKCPSGALDRRRPAEPARRKQKNPELPTRELGEGDDDDDGDDNEAGKAAAEAAAAAAEPTEAAEREALEQSSEFERPRRQRSPHERRSAAAANLGSRDGPSRTKALKEEEKEAGRAELAATKTIRTKSTCSKLAHMRQATRQLAAADDQEGEEEEEEKDDGEDNDDESCVSAAAAVSCERRASNQSAANNKSKDASEMIAPKMQIMVSEQVEWRTRGAADVERCRQRSSVAERPSAQRASANKQQVKSASKKAALNVDDADGRREEEDECEIHNDQEEKEADEQEEEIRIVAQKCRLHHHGSMHSLLVKSNQLSLSKFVNEKLAQPSGRCQIEAPAQKLRRRCVQLQQQQQQRQMLAEQSAPRQRALQRYISMDSLAMKQQQQQQQQQERQVSNSTVLISKRFVGSQFSGQALAREYAQAVNNADASARKQSAGQLAHHQTARTYRRSNSVMGEPYRSAACAQDFLREPNGYACISGLAAATQLASCCNSATNPFGPPDCQAQQRTRRQVTTTSCEDGAGGCSKTLTHYASSQIATTRPPLSALVEAQFPTCCMATRQQATSVTLCACSALSSCRPTSKSRPPRMRHQASEACPASALGQLARWRTRSEDKLNLLHLATPSSVYNSSVASNQALQSEACQAAALIASNKHVRAASKRRQMATAAAAALLISANPLHSQQEISASPCCSLANQAQTAHRLRNGSAISASEYTLLVERGLQQQQQQQRQRRPHNYATLAGAAVGPAPQLSGAAHEQRRRLLASAAASAATVANCCIARQQAGKNLPACCTMVAVPQQAPRARHRLQAPLECCNSATKQQQKLCTSNRRQQLARGGCERPSCSAQNSADESSGYQSAGNERLVREPVKPRAPQPPRRHLSTFTAPKSAPAPTPAQGKHAAALRAASPPVANSGPPSSSSCFASSERGLSSSDSSWSANSPPYTTKQQRATAAEQRSKPNVGAGATSCAPTAPAAKIPRPPPMPLDSSLESGAAAFEPPAPPHRQLRPASESSSSRASGAAAAAPNPLCFVDELKMLAERSASLASGAPALKQAATRTGEERARDLSQHCDSATLIKVINASKTAAAAAASKCTAADCCGSSQWEGGNKAGSAAAAARQRRDCCASAAKKAGASKPALKNAKLRDEEDNKRRQHELLMEEFKSAHSKMFANKLRRQQQQQQQVEAT